MDPESQERSERDYFEREAKKYLEVINYLGSEHLRRPDRFGRVRPLEPLATPETVVRLADELMTQKLSAKQKFEKDIGYDFDQAVAEMSEWQSNSSVNK